jgi:hypothetical protein
VFKYIQEAFDVVAGMILTIMMLFQESIWKGNTSQTRALVEDAKDKVDTSSLRTIEIRKSFIGGMNVDSA